MAKPYKAKTPEQKKKEINDLTSSMKERIPEYFRSEESIKEYLDFMGKFHNYSQSNSNLIEGQYRGAEAVGSFVFWKNKGFNVNKGEKGIKILVPKVTTYFERNGKETQLKYATKIEKEKIENKQIPSYKRTFFDIGNVFDVSQTSATAKDLPEVFPNRWLEGSVKNYSSVYKALEKVAKENDISIVEPKSELGVAKGISYTLLKEVALNPRNSELQNVKTLVHELGHAVLHNAETHKNYTAAEKEFQAELTAYTVSSYFGMDTSEYSLPYLNHWTQGKELADQERLLREVRETSHGFISIIEEELINERSFTMANEREFDYDHLLGSVIYEANSSEKVLLIKDLNTNEDLEFKIDDRNQSFNVSGNNTNRSLEGLLSVDSMKNLNDARATESTTSFMLSKDELANLHKNNLIQNEVRREIPLVLTEKNHKMTIERGEGETPAEIKMLDATSEKEYTLGVWNPEPEDRDDLYICPVDRSSIGEQDQLTDVLASDVLSHEKYVELQENIFDKDEDFVMVIEEKDLKIDLNEYVMDERFGAWAERDVAEGYTPFEVNQYKDMLSKDYGYPRIDGMDKEIEKDLSLKYETFILAEKEAETNNYEMPHAEISATLEGDYLTQKNLAKEGGFPVADLQRVEKSVESELAKQGIALDGDKPVESKEVQTKIRTAVRRHEEELER